MFCLHPDAKILHASLMETMFQLRVNNHTTDAGTEVDGERTELLLERGTTPSFSW